MRWAVVTFPGSLRIRTAWINWSGSFIRKWFLSGMAMRRFQMSTGTASGGFSYGDYLRAGSIARFSPLKAVSRFAEQGGFVRDLQWLSDFAEAGLLPGHAAQYWAVFHM